MLLMVPKADTSEHFTALLPPCPAFLGEEDDTTEKEPYQKTGSVPPFRKGMAFRASFLAVTSPSCPHAEYTACGQECSDVMKVRASQLR